MPLTLLLSVIVEFAPLQMVASELRVRVAFGAVFTVILKLLESVPPLPSFVAI